MDYSELSPTIIDLAFCMLIFFSFENFQLEILKNISFRPTIVIVFYFTKVLFRVF